VLTSVLLLAYKEEENLKALLPQINGVLGNMDGEFEVLVVDSATPLDGTKAVCDEYGARYISQEEPHYGGAFRTGIRYALGDRIQVLDADGSHDPNVIPSIRAMFDKGYDLVIGSRYVKGGSTHDSTSSQIMSRILNTAMRMLIGVDAHDISTSFRMYDAAQLKSVRLVRNNFDVLQEVILRMKLNNRRFSIAEVPIVFEKRVFGESKRQLARFIIGYIGTAVYILSLRLRHAFHR